MQSGIGFWVAYTSRFGWRGARSGADVPGAHLGMSVLGDVPGWHPVLALGRGLLMNFVLKWRLFQVEMQKIHRISSVEMIFISLVN